MFFQAKEGMLSILW